MYTWYMCTMQYILLTPDNPDFSVGSGNTAYVYIKYMMYTAELKVHLHIFIMDYASRSIPQLASYHICHTYILCDNP